MAITSPTIPGPSPQGGRPIQIPNTNNLPKAYVPKLTPKQIYTPHIGLKLGTG